MVGALSSPAIAMIGQAPKMRFLTTALLFVALLAGFSAVAPEPAQAQRCPPGIPGGGNPACIPPDVYNGGQGNDSGGAANSEPVPVSWKAGHSALVWHPDATEVWAVWNANTLEIATDLAMVACTAVMGEGCVTAISSIGGTIAFGPGPDGYTRAAWGAKKKDAIKKFHQQCAQAGVTCRVQETFTSTHIKWPVMVMVQPMRTVAHLPETRGVAAYGAVVSPKPDPVGTKWQGHVWMTTGKASYADATEQALALCRSATGLECGLDAHGVNSSFYLYTTNDDMFFWSLGLSRKEAEADLAKKCKLRFKGKKCSIVGFYDMATPRNDMVLMGMNPEFVKGG